MELQKPKSSTTKKSSSASSSSSTNLQLPDYLLNTAPASPSAPPAEESPQVAQERKQAVEEQEAAVPYDNRWEIVEADLGFVLTGNRTTATKVVESLRTLDEEEKTALRDDLSTIEGSRDLLMRLEHCIQSERFQSRIWRRIQDRDPRNKQKKASHEATMDEKEMKEAADEEADLAEQGFVLVSHAQVVDALAEHLVLTYIENYHANEIEAIRRSREPTSVFGRILYGLGNMLGRLAKSVVLDSLWTWGLSIATSTAGLATIAAVNPQIAVFAVTVIWQVLKFGFAVLM